MGHRCIYCGKDHDLSESDIIPDALTGTRIINKNVCRIEHNNKFSDMFESEVIEALAFITNQLDIKSSKGKKYASYTTILEINGTNYETLIRSDNDIFKGGVIKSVDNKQVISSYETASKIAKDKSKLQALDMNTAEIVKKVKVNSKIFFDIPMYRMVSKIAFEWYCARNKICDYYPEFSGIIEYITLGKGVNPVSIIQNEEVYEKVNLYGNRGSHMLFASEKENGEIEVIVSLFGLLMYRVIVTKKRPDNCISNFLYTELRIDSLKNYIYHRSLEEAWHEYNKILSQDNCVCIEECPGTKIMTLKSKESVKKFHIYRFWFDMMEVLSKANDDANGPNERINSIFLGQLKIITQGLFLHKKSIKRFVNDTFDRGCENVELNLDSTNLKTTILFYILYRIGLSEAKELSDEVFQKIVPNELFNLLKNEYNEYIVDDKVKNTLKNIMMTDDNYSEVLKKGAEKVRNWNN